MATPNLQPAEPPRRIGRSILAVIAGILTGAIPSIGTDLLMVALGLMPALGQPAPDGALVCATIYRTLYGILGSYITARLAPHNPMTHAIVLGILGFIVSAAGAAATWNHQPPLGPHWYPVALVVLALPTAWLGGKLRLMQN